MKIFVKNLKGNHFQLQVKPQDTAPATPKSPSIEASITPPTTVPKEALPASMPTSVPTPIFSSSVSESDVGGQAAVSLDAGNGVWFMHCHLELHTGWELKIAFTVEDGPGPEYSVLPPPKNLPHC